MAPYHHPWNLKGTKYALSPCSLLAKIKYVLFLYRRSYKERIIMPNGYANPKRKNECM